MREDPAVAALVVHCCNVLRQRPGELPDASGVVVGCGSGDEVVYMRRALATERVVGVDVEPRFSSVARAGGGLLVADAKRLPFPSQAFDFAAAFHSLEPVGNPRSALDKVQRVLRPRGWFYLGVPNKSRLVGYLGSFDATAWQKIEWNLIDWKARLLGRFRNECGAHAGFERRELVCLLGERFTKVPLLTEEFIRFKYAGRFPTPLLDLLLNPSVIDYSAPAHYALCQKPRLGEPREGCVRSSDAGPPVRPRCHTFGR